MARAHCWFDDLVSGRFGSMGYLDSHDDVYQYDSSEFQFIGFDELTSFSEWQYTYLFSRLRTTKDNPVPLRMRSASNPGNRGHDWVKERFLIGQPREMLQLLWFNPGGQVPHKRVMRSMELFAAKVMPHFA